MKTLLAIAARRLHLIGLGLVCLAVVSACGGGEDRSKAQLRLVHASTGYDSLDLVSADDRVQAGVGYGGRAGYTEIDPTDPDLEIRRAGASAALYSSQPALSKGKHYSLVAYGREGVLRAVLLTDEEREPDRNKVRLRVLNGAPEVGKLDVYLTAADTALADSAPLHAGAEPGVASDFADADAGTWRLRVTVADDADDLRLDLSGLPLSSRQVVTVVVTPGSGGVLVNALLLTQQGSIGVLDGAQARVRAVAGTAGGSVQATVNGVRLLGGEGAPVVGDYQLVPAGAASAELAVNGSPVAVPAADLAAGTDHTLLVRGDVAAPSASWLADDNRPATVTSRSRLRLVHGLTGLPGPLALTMDFGPVANSVLPGSASAATTVDAKAKANLSVTTPDSAAPVFVIPEAEILAGKVYSLFMVGAAGAPTGILYADR